MMSFQYNELLTQCHVLGSQIRDDIETLKQPTKAVYGGLEHQYIIHDKDRKFNNGKEYD